MLRMGGGGILAAVAGAAVVIGGVWAQFRAVDGEPGEAPALWIAVAKQDPTTGERRLVVLNSATDAELVLNAADMLPVAPAWSPDGSRLVWIEADREPKEIPSFFGTIWDRETGKRHRFPVEFLDFNRFEWAPNSSMVADLGQTLQIWDRSGHPVVDEPPPSGGFSTEVRRRSGSPSWSADSSQISYFINDQIVVWSRSDGIERLSFNETALPGTINDYALVERRDGPVFVVMRFTGDGFDAFEVNLDGLIKPVPAPEYPIEPVDAPGGPDLGLAERYGPGVVTSGGRSADGRASFAFWIRPDNPGEGSSEGGIRVVGPAGAFELEIDNLELSVRSRDVVLVGDWPAP